jgi:hypothetical protein
MTPGNESGATFRLIRACAIAEFAEGEANAQHRVCDQNGEFSVSSLWPRVKRIQQKIHPIDDASS